MKKVTGLLGDIEAIVAVADDRDDVEKMAALAELFLTKPSGAVSAIGSAARTRSYMMALDDIPAWAVKDAIRLWHRGEVPGFTMDDFKWAPDSAALRMIARAVLQPYKDKAAEIRLLLTARPLAEVI